MYSQDQISYEYLFKTNQDIGKNIYSTKTSNIVLSLFPLFQNNLLEIGSLISYVLQVA